MTKSFCKVLIFQTFRTILATVSVLLLQHNMKMRGAKVFVLVGDRGTSGLMALKAGLQEREGRLTKLARGHPTATSGLLPSGANNS
jgi:hypothetical protein